MVAWRERLTRLLYQAETRFDRCRLRLKYRLGRFDPVHILPFYGYGSAQEWYLKGRVLEDKGIIRSKDDDTLWDNLVRMYKRFGSSEVPGVRVRAQYLNVVQNVTTDEEGYFEVRLRPPGPLRTDRVWHDIDLRLLDTIVPAQGPVTSIGHVLVPALQSRFGVISDIDDTIVKTQATDWLKMARMVLLANARTRLPLAGVAAFYRALQGGANGMSPVPFFYVSSSPWNLYDLFVHFMEIHDIPAGPLLLRDLGLSQGVLIQSSHAAHKRDQIERLLQHYPDLKFILIGDSGQRDPEIYRQVVMDFPGRIRAIYIQDASVAKRGEVVKTIAHELSLQGVDMLLIRDTVAAAEHAAAHGLIDAATLPTIRDAHTREANSTERTV